MFTSFIYPLIEACVRKRSCETKHIKVFVQRSKPRADVSIYPTAIWLFWLYVQWIYLSQGENHPGAHYMSHRKLLKF